MKQRDDFWLYLNTHETIDDRLPRMTIVQYWGRASEAYEAALAAMTAERETARHESEYLNRRIESLQKTLYMLGKDRDDLAAERDALAGQLKQARGLLDRALPILKEDIGNYGDDHSVGVCCCDIINLVDDIAGREP